MQDKYYTPEIEEFHVGFEFESFVDRFKEWKFNKVGKYELNAIAAIINYDFRDLYRVKYLDEQDIKSLEFKEDTYNGVKCFTKNNCQIFYFAPETHIISIDCFSNDYRQTYFKGLIKNKLELKRILKMIGHGC